MCAYSPAPLWSPPRPATPTNEWDLGSAPRRPLVSLRFLTGGELDPRAKQSREESSSSCAVRRAALTNTPCINKPTTPGACREAQQTTVWPGSCGSRLATTRRPVVIRSYASSFLSIDWGVPWQIYGAKDASCSVIAPAPRRGLSSSSTRALGYGVRVRNIMTRAVKVPALPCTRLIIDRSSRIAAGTSMASFWG